MVRLMRSLLLALGALYGLLGAPAAKADEPLLLFGGEDHKQFLGCLNCSQYDQNAVTNKYGPYGSPYSLTSIFNKFSDFGSKFSAYGACGHYSSDPPVIVDNQGRSYGRLTMNRFAPGAVTSGPLLVWLSQVVCGED